MRDLRELAKELKEALEELRKSGQEAKRCMLYELLSSDVYDISYLTKGDSVFQAILDNIPVGVYFKAVSGEYMAVNDELCQLYGMKKEDIIGRTSYDFFPKEIADRFSEGDRLLIEGKTSERLEHRGRFPGKHDSFHIIQKQAFVKDGVVRGIIGVITDMTELKKVEDRAWASEAFFKSIFELSPMPVILINSMNMITDANSTAERVFAGLGILPGQDISELFASFSDYENAMMAKDGMARVNVIKAGGGTVEMLTMVSSSVNNGETYYAIVFVRTDI